MVSLIEQVGREKDRSRSQAKSEEESYDDVVSYDEEEASPQVATGGKGSGFSYLFPPSEQRSEFAVNPSDPLYYSAPDGIRSAPKELETREEMEDQEEAPSPIGRFPEVKPIKFTTDVEMPHEEIEETARPQPPEHVRPKAPEPVRPIPPESILSRPNVREKPTQHHLVQSDDVKKEKASIGPIADNYYVYLTAIIAGCSAAGIVGVIAAGIFYFK
ncbi:hypothetical protein J437_LFUL013217 [Ladona fulva]|uniref:Uncharacterized protein n=1 Tax=Ladona fulva TaxID=123851 RepID=A0A8K0KJR7_LADFU|nr:hypothetical protein J437_LFUL013217 [Ladona fulva]